MKTKTRYFVWTLWFLGFVYVASGGALALHLEANDNNKHDSSHCYTCQRLTMLTERILVEAPPLIPELSLTECSFSYSASNVINHATVLPVHPRAPPV